MASPHPPGTYGAERAAIVATFAEKAAALIVCCRGNDLHVRLEALRKEEHDALFALKERTIARVAPKPPAARWKEPDKEPPVPQRGFPIWRGLLRYGELDLR